MTDYNRKGAATVNTWGAVVKDTFTRPADTTAYTIGDRIAATTDDTDTTPLRPLILGRITGKPFLLSELELVTNKVDFLPTIEVSFFDVDAPPTAIVGDNAAFNDVFANRLVRLGEVTLPIMTAIGDGSRAVSRDLRTLLNPVTASLTIYYALKITAGTSITPASAQQFDLIAKVLDI